MNTNRIPKLAMALLLLAAVGLPATLLAGCAGGANPLNATAPTATGASSARAEAPDAAPCADAETARLIQDAATASPLNVVWGEKVGPKPPKGRTAGGCGERAAPRNVVWSE